MKIWRHTPFVALLAVIALAMGIGFTTTMFAIVHGATRPLPFADAEEIVAIEPVIEPSEFAQWKTARSFESMAAFESIAVNLADAQADPERINGVTITPNTFGLLGATALLGRTLQHDDGRAGASPVVLLSHRLWQRRFAGDLDVVGKTVRLTGVTHTIIGVMPERFGFPVNASFWTAAAVDETAAVSTTAAIRRLRVFGRLANGVSMDTAQAELQTLAAGTHLSAETASAQRRRVDVMAFADLETPREVVRALYLLVVAVSFVLLIACANVANLLVARAAVRARDVALRLALGATPRRLVNEQLVETFLLAAIGSVLGLLFAYAGTRAFAINTAHIIEAFWVDFRVDAVVLVFASLLAGVSTMAAGLGPALRAARSNVADVLKDGTFGSSSFAIGRFSRSLIAVQITLACGLLAFTMILARAALDIRAVSWPFDPASVLTFEFELPDTVAADVAARNRRLAEFTTALNATVGVSLAALTTALPGRGAGNWSFTLDQPSESQTDSVRAPATAIAFVSPEFFALTRARLQSGRLLDWQDDATAARVAVVNESFVRRFSSDRVALGRRIFLGAREFTVVGVVSDGIAHDVQDRARDGVYLSILQTRPFGVRVMAEGPSDPTAMMPAIRDTVRRFDSDMPITEVFTLSEAVYRDKRVLDVLSALFSIFGVGALSLTAIGLYGVISFAVAQQTRELGIRMAVGASRARVVRIVVAQGARQLVVGLALGIALAIALSRAFAAAVEQLPPADAPLLVGICGAVGVTVMAAVALPARRAIRLDVMQALRRE